MNKIANMMISVKLKPEYRSYFNKLTKVQSGKIGYISVAPSFHDGVKG